MIFSKQYYTKTALELGPLLIGQKLVYIDASNVRKEGIITELEAYGGPGDKASHAYTKKTQRNTPMYDSYGHTYVYLCYGIHNLLNITCAKVNDPQAILVRGFYDIHIGVHYNGPGKLTRHLGITRDDNMAPLYGQQSHMWIEYQGTDYSYTTHKRIGIEYAQEAKDFPWRYILNPDAWGDIRKE